MQPLWGLGSDWTNGNPAPPHHTSSAGRYAGFIVRVSVHPCTSPSTSEPCCEGTAIITFLWLSVTVTILVPWVLHKCWQRYFQEKVSTNTCILLLRAEATTLSKVPQMCGVLLDANMSYIWRNYVYWKSNIAWIYSTLCTLKSINTAIH